MDRFEKSRLEIENNGKWIRGVVKLAFLCAFCLMILTGIAAYRSGCVESKLLNGVCVSDPHLDKAFKGIFHD